MKCSPSHVAASQEVRYFPVTFDAEDANLNLVISEPSVSGISEAAYRSRIFPGEPCAWSRVILPCL